MKRFREMPSWLERLVNGIIMFGIACLLMYGLLRGMAAYGQEASVTLVWDANTESDLAGYRLYQSLAPGQHGPPNVAEIPAGTETTTLTIPDEQDTYFVLSAYDQAGNESGYSDEVKADFAPVKPCGLLLTIE